MGLLGLPPRPRSGLRARTLSSTKLLGLVLGLIPAALTGAGAPPRPHLQPAPLTEAPPPNPPFATRPSAPSLSPPRLAAPAAYSIGEPTDEEQLYVEYINRARANPPEEGLRLAADSDPNVISAISQYGVDLDQLRADFQAFAPAPPLSVQPHLMSAARRHTDDQFTNGFQGHDGSDGSKSSTRVTEAGYVWNAVGENVYINAKSVWQGHAAFNIDWGFGPGGVQNPPGHRLSIHNPAFREIGVGVINGNNGPAGPQVVTQVFASRNGLTPLVTGVVYYDFNGNEFYDLGEGIGGVPVRISGTSDYAITARSGGYSVPVAGNGDYTVTFEVPGLAAITKPATVAASANVKVDHRPVYSPPTLGGTTVAYVGHDNPYVFSPVGAATGYDWSVRTRSPWVTPEGAENGWGRMVADVFPDYTPISMTVKYAGAAAFHLAHPQAPRSDRFRDQYLTLVNPVRVGPTSELQFRSRLRVASASQFARVQISEDGLTWHDVWSQAGRTTEQNGDFGESQFFLRTVALTEWAGKPIRLRFAYTFNPSSLTDVGFTDVQDHLGWLIDDIVVTDAEELSDEQVHEVASGTSFEFRPDAVGLYLLQVRARIGDRLLPWGTPLGVTAQEGGPTPAEVRVTGLSPANGGWEITFRVESGSATAWAVEAADSPAGPWTDAGVAIEATGVAGEYHGQIPPGGGGSARFFRVAAN